MINALTKPAFSESSPRLRLNEKMAPGLTTTPSSLRAAMTIFCVRAAVEPRNVVTPLPTTVQPAGILARGVGVALGGAGVGEVAGALVGVAAGAAAVGLGVAGGAG